MKYLNLKSYTLLLLGIGFFTQTSVAQKMYLDVNVGYGVPVSGSTMFLSDRTSFKNNFTGDYNYTQKTIPLSLGNGINFGINAGYLINKNIGFDLGINYQLGNEISGTINSTYFDPLPSPQYEYSTFTESYKSNMLYITPSFLLRTDLEKFSPYTKLGLALGYGKIINKHSEEDNRFGSSTSTKEFTGGLALGFEMSIGGTYTINDKLGVYAEAYYRNMTYSPKKATITSYTKDGEDYIDQLTTSFKETEFSKEVTENIDRNQFDFSSPSKETLISFPYHSLGLKLGLRINL